MTWSFEKVAAGGPTFAVFLSLTFCACGGDDSGESGFGGTAGVGASSAGGTTTGGSSNGGSGPSSGGTTPGSGGAAGSGGSSAGTTSGGTSGSGGSGGSSAGGAGGTGGTVPNLSCPALPASSGNEIRVSPSEAGSLPGIVYDAPAGSVIVLEDGTYPISSQLHFVTDNITLRSASDDATKVVIDGEYSNAEGMLIQSSNVTIAHVTLTRMVDHGIHVVGGGDAGDSSDVHIYGVRLIDHGEQFIKINRGGSDTYSDDGSVKCSYFELTDTGRPMIEDFDSGACYTGGIDTHGSRGWLVQSNTFLNIYCDDEGLAEHAVHFWSAARDTVVENNIILGCARGIGFGLVESGASRDYDDDPYPGVGYIGHYDGIIRNNVIWADHPYFDSGIELAQARGARVLHNTVMSGSGATGFYTSIDYRFANTEAAIHNNIVQVMTQRNGGQASLSHNLETSDLSLFENASQGDFHLVPAATSAIDQGTVVSGSGVDLDGESRDKGAAPDLGADEH